MGDRRRVLLRLLPVVILLAAGAAGFTGRTTVALAGLAIGIAALVLVDVALRGPSEPVAPLDADESAALRRRREQNGEVAAVRQLREGRPGLSLVDAVRLVREL